MSLRRRGKPLIASLRGGCLLDDAARGAAAGGASRRSTARRWPATWSAPGSPAASNGPATRRRPRCTAALEAATPARGRAAAHRPARDRPRRGRREARRARLCGGAPSPATRAELADAHRRRHRRLEPRHAPAPDLPLRGRRARRQPRRGRRRDRRCCWSPAAARPGSARTACTNGSPSALAAAGYPCLRFDRRGVGDSEGEDPGFRGSGARPRRGRRGLPERDARRSSGCSASACATAPPRSPCSAARPGSTALILVNPWLVEAEAGEPPPAAIRAIIASGCSACEGWKKILSGAVDYRKLFRGIRKIVATRRQLAAGATTSPRRCAGSRLPAELILAERRRHRDRRRRRRSKRRAFERPDRRRRR